jgi:hypothetical protein
MERLKGEAEMAAMPGEIAGNQVVAGPTKRPNDRATPRVRGGSGLLGFLGESSGYDGRGLSGQCSPPLEG